MPSPTRPRGDPFFLDENSFCHQTVFRFSKKNSASIKKIRRRIFFCIFCCCIFSDDSVFFSKPSFCQQVFFVWVGPFRGPNERLQRHKAAPKNPNLCTMMHHDHGGHFSGDIPSPSAKGPSKPIGVLPTLRISGIGGHAEMGGGL